MPLIETDSLVLKTYNLAEADKIVVMLTRDHGIIRGVAKGAKRLKSRFGSSLEPFSTVKVTYFQKETLELVSIQKMELIDSFFSAASDPDFLQKFSYLTDILVASVPPQDPSETVYRMVRACLTAAVNRPKQLDAIGFYFEIWLLKLSGYLPQWKRCSECEREFAPDETAGLSADQTLVCGKCRRLESMVKIGPGKRLILRQVLSSSPADFAESATDVNSIGELSEIFKRVISQTLGRPVSEGRALTATLPGK